MEIEFIIAFIIIGILMCLIVYALSGISDQIQFLTRQIMLIKDTTKDIEVNTNK